MRAVVADTAGKWPYFEDVTAGFVYVRLHGDKKLYASGYSGAALDRWATRVDAWRNGGELAAANKISEKAPAKRRGRDVFCRSEESRVGKEWCSKCRYRWAPWQNKKKK